MTAIEQRALLQNTIAQNIVKYLPVDDLWSCSQVFESWAFLGPSQIALNETSMDEKEAILGLATKSDSALFLVEGGPTSHGCIPKLLKHLTGNSNLLTLIELDLSKQSLEVTTFINLFQTEGDTCVFPKLRYLSVALHTKNSTQNRNRNDETDDEDAEEEDDDEEQKEKKDISDSEMKMPKSLQVMSVHFIKIATTEPVKLILKSMNSATTVNWRETLCKFLPLTDELDVFNRVEHLTVPANSQLLNHMVHLKTESKPFTFPSLDSLTVECLHNTITQINIEALKKLFSEISVYINVSNDIYLQYWKNIKIDDIWNNNKFQSINVALENDKSAIVTLHACRNSLLEKSLIPQELNELHLNLNLMQYKTSPTSKSEAEAIFSRPNSSVRHVSLRCDIGKEQQTWLSIKDLVGKLWKDKCIPLLSSCSSTLSSVVVSANLVYGSSAIDTGVTLPWVKKLTIESDLLLKRADKTKLTIPCENLVVFFKMFPNLDKLHVLKNYFVDWSQLSDILSVCPSLRRLYLDCYQLSTKQDTDLNNLLQKDSLNDSLNTLVLKLRGNANLHTLLPQMTFLSLHYVYIYTQKNGIPELNILKKIFRNMPRAVWLIVASRALGKTFLCSRSGKAIAPCFKRQKTISPTKLCTLYPELYYIFWKNLLVGDSMPIA